MTSSAESNDALLRQAALACRAHVPLLPTGVDETRAAQQQLEACQRAASAKLRSSARRISPFLGPPSRQGYENAIATCRAESMVLGGDATPAASTARRARLPDARMRARAAFVAPIAAAALALVAAAPPAAPPRPDPHDRALAHQLSAKVAAFRAVVTKSGAGLQKSIDSCPAAKKDPSQAFALVFAAVPALFTEIVTEYKPQIVALRDTVGAMHPDAPVFGTWLTALGQSFDLLLEFDNHGKQVDICKAATVLARQAFDRRGHPARARHRPDADRAALHEQAPDEADEAGAADDGRSSSPRASRRRTRRSSPPPPRSARLRRRIEPMLPSGRTNGVRPTRSNERSSTMNTVSRRSFLKTAGVATGAAAITTSPALAAAIQPEPPRRRPAARSPTSRSSP